MDESHASRHEGVGRWGRAVTGTEIEFRHGLEGEAEVHAAAMILLEAFTMKVNRMKLFPRSDEQAERVLAQQICPGQAFVALRQGQVVGIAGVDDRNGNLKLVNWRVLAREFGRLGAAWRGVWLKALRVLEAPGRGELRVTAIAVEGTMRGRGVGGSLLGRVIEHARQEGYRAVVLDVVDTNPARRLYERMGFKAVRTSHLGALTRGAGFSAVTRMRKETMEGAR